MSDSIDRHHETSSDASFFCTDCDQVFKRNDYEGDASN